MAKKEISQQHFKEKVENEETIGRLTHEISVKDQSQSQMRTENIELREKLHQEADKKHKLSQEVIEVEEKIRGFEHEI